MADPRDAAREKAIAAFDKLGVYWRRLTTPEQDAILVACEAYAAALAPEQMTDWHTEHDAAARVETEKRLRALAPVASVPPPQWGEPELFQQDFGDTWEVRAPCGCEVWISGPVVRSVHCPQDHDVHSGEALLRAAIERDGSVEKK